MDRFRGKTNQAVFFKEICEDNNFAGESITKLALRTRTANALSASGILTIEQLVRCTPLMITRIPNAGKVTLCNIEEALAWRGLRLAPDPEPYKTRSRRFKGWWSEFQEAVVLF